VINQDEQGSEYPWGQWINRGGDIEPRQDTGKFFFNDQSLNALGAVPDGAEVSTAHFSSGKAEDGVIVDALTVAPVISRMRYFTGMGADRVYYPQYIKGSRGNINLLCYVQTEQGLKGPVVLTASGTVSKDLYLALKAHRHRVKESTNGAAPAPLFLITLETGTPEKRGQKGAESLVTPLVFEEDFDPDRDYIGDDLADAIEERWEEFKEWRAEWGKQQADEDDDEVDEPEAPRQTQRQQPPAQQQRKPAQPQRPARPSSTDGNPLGAARERWSSAWNALKQAGVAAPMLNPSYKTAAQVNRAAEIMESIKDSIRDGDTPAQIREALDDLLSSV